MAVRHIIWDWNGTLLDDLPVVVGAVDHTVRRLGGDPVTHDDYRDHYTRPVRLLYERLTGHTLTDAEWRMIDREFHRVYHDRVHEVELAEHAVAALDSVLSVGQTQSLLSMYAHPELVDVVDRFDIGHYFIHVQGLVGLPGGRKAEHLERHLADLRTRGVEAGTTVMIGDTPDDAHAAADHGIPCVLYDGGSHHRRDLEQVGVPVVDSLPAAVATALQA